MLSDVKSSFLDSANEFVLKLEAIDPVNVDLSKWLKQNHEALRQSLNLHGGVLLRDFGVDSAAEFSQAVSAFSPNMLRYTERAASRREICPGVFTSTMMAKDQVIPLHHEMSYSHMTPGFVMFYCDIAPQEQGRTPVSNERKVTRRIPQEIIDTFERKGGIRYMRNFNAMVDMSWQDAFQTTNKSEVEAYLSDSDTQWQWIDDDHLQTFQTRQLFAEHPQTKERFWFNHAHMFHWSNMPEELSEALISLFGEEGLPRNAMYADGSPIDAELLETIRQIYTEESVAFDWQKGDVMILDNFICAHGREPFDGPRSILVAMTDKQNVWHKTA